MAIEANSVPSTTMSLDEIRQRLDFPPPSRDGILYPTFNEGLQAKFTYSFSEALKDPYEFRKMLELLEDQSNKKAPAVVTFIQSFLYNNIDTMIQKANDHKQTGAINDVRAPLLELIHTLYAKNAYGENAPLDGPPTNVRFRKIINALDKNSNMFLDDTGPLDKYATLMAYHHTNETRQARKHIADRFSQLLDNSFPSTRLEKISLSMSAYFRNLATAYPLSSRNAIERVFEQDPVVQMLLDKTVGIIKKTKKEELFARLVACGNGALDKSANTFSDAAFTASNIDNIGIRLVKNYYAIQRLEGMSSGITERLCENNGIHLFFRYPLEILMQQDKDYKAAKEGTKKPRVAAIFAVTDHTATIHNPIQDYNNSRSFDAFSGLFDKLYDLNYGLSIYEANDQRQISKFLDQEVKYSDGKLASVILVGHGTEDAIHFSTSPTETPKESDLRLEDTPNLAVKLNDCLTPNGQVILVSCYAGRALGPKLQDHLGNLTKVHASQDAIDLVDFQVRNSSGYIKIEPQFIKIQQPTYYSPY